VTAQVANRIRLHGKHQRLLSSPERPFLEALPKPVRFNGESTANWSGYVSHFEVRHGRLYLVDLTGLICTRPEEEGAEPAYWCHACHFDDCERKRITLHEICDVPFGGFPATWFTGELRIPQGELREYVHAGWASSYQRELLVEIRKGVVVSERLAPSVAPLSLRNELAGASLLKRLIAVLRTQY
jgi:hypothetical protein